MAEERVKEGRRYRETISGTQESHRKFTRGKMNKTYLERFLEKPENLRLFLQERAVHDVTDLLEASMKEVGVSRSELARRLGVSRSWVTQLLDGEANKTIRTVADA